MRRHVYLATTVAVMTALVVLAASVVTLASPASGVTPMQLSRGTVEDFKVRSYPQGPGDFKAESKGPTDIVVRQHDYAVGSHTGWHSHPGPVFITVTKGVLTYYEYDDPKCTPHEVRVGQTFVDNGRGHIVRNLSGEPAQDISVIIAPVAGAFRGELDAPGPYCGF